MSISTDIWHVQGAGCSDAGCLEVENRILWLKRPIIYNDTGFQDLLTGFLAHFSLKTRKDHVPET